ncbi:unnamed protein product [Alopecurus aequalis]
MERKDGCCGLAPGYGGAAGQAWQVGNIMLKFRPIAPKPAAMAPAPMTPAVGAGKRKRKAAVGSGGGGNKRGRKPKKAAATVATAPAATQKVDDAGKDKPLSSSPSSSSSGMTSVDSSTPPPPPPATPLVHAPSPAEKEGFSVAALKPLRPVVASCVVTVESVTGTWRDAGEAPSAGGDDEAPAFVSDQWGRVTWMNLAFSRAVSSGATATSASASDAGVVLAAKDGADVPAWGSCAGFTCRVRVTYACPRRGSLVAPCDVWRLDAAAGYLWRLDLQATLTLSLRGLL